MKARYPQSAWPRNDSPAAKALVLIDFVLRHQAAFAVGAMAATAFYGWVMQ